MSITSVARPLITAVPMVPGCSLTSSMSKRLSTMSMISSTTSAIERCSSENTSSGWRPAVFMRTSSLAGTSGMS